MSRSRDSNRKKAEPPNSDISWSLIARAASGDRGARSIFSRGYLPVVRTFLDTGSHYLTHAEWGCSDGVHKAWMIVETETREQAALIVPPFMRGEARVIQLSKFFTDEMGGILTSHGDPE